VLLLRESGAAPATPPVDAYVVAVGEVAQRQALSAVEKLRDARPGLGIIQHTGGGSFKSQIKRADRSGARVALIWGEDEVAQQRVSLKPLRREGTAGDGQQSVPVAELEPTLLALLAN